MSSFRDDASGLPPGLEECNGLRERKARRTRQAIHDAAVRRVFDDGLEAATVASIAEDAGISPRTFFNYFATKEDAVLSGLTAEEDAQRAAHLVAEADLAEPIAALPEILREVFFIGGDDAETTRMRRAILHRHPHLLSRKLVRNAAVERVVVDAVSERLDEVLDSDVRTALADGGFGPVEAARLIVHLMAVPLQFTNAANGAAQAAAEAGTPAESADAAVELTELFDRGLAILSIVLTGDRS